MQGKRIDNDKWPENPGEYSKFKQHDGVVFWACMLPDGQMGRLSTHDIVEHEDNTITVSPSILVTGEKQWHGYLEHGVWREC